MADKKHRKNNKVTIGGWMGTLIISAIPVVNLVMWFVWAFKARKPSRRTFSVACLILTAIFVLLAAVSIALWGKEIVEWARQLSPTLFSDAIVLE